MQTNVSYVMREVNKTQVKKDEVTLILLHVNYNDERHSGCVKNKPTSLTASAFSKSKLSLQELVLDQFPYRLVEMRSYST